MAQEGVNVPKPLVKIKNEALIDRLIRIFMMNDAEEILVICNNLTSLVASHLEGIKQNGLNGKHVPLRYIVKTTPSSMHSFYELSSYLGNTPFVLTTVDTIFREDEFSQYIAAFRQLPGHYQGLMGAYREYSKALDDLRLARESRMRVEAECQRSIEMIRAYRMEAEQRVSEYMNEHLDAFQSGFAAMDQAILANDPDGYIAGNVQIQQMLGAEIQFTNQEEFDALMDSDDAFKL